MELLIFLTVGVGVVVAGYVTHSRRSERWRRFALDQSLRYTPPNSWLDLPRLDGIHRGTGIRITVKERGGGDDSYKVTQVRARLAIPLARRLNVTTARFGDSLTSLFSEDVVIGGEFPYDSELRIRGASPAEVRRVFRHEALTEEIRRCLVDHGSSRTPAIVAERFIRIEERGWIVSPGSLTRLMDSACSIASRIDDAMRLAAVPPGEPPKPPPPRARKPVLRPQPAAAAGASRITEMVAELRAESVVHSRGDFSIDRAAAKRKMRDYQLNEPEAYVLELVRSAVCRGARTIDVSIDADDMRMHFDGPAFTVEDFEKLYGSIFTSGDDSMLRSLRHLAVGINTALGMPPSYLSIQSGDDTSGATLTARPGEDDVFGPLDRASQVGSGTTVHVKLPWSQLLSGRRTRLRKLLRERCRFAAPVVLVDGERVSRGHGRGLDGAVGAVAIDTDGLRGRAGFTAEADEPALYFQSDGVWLERCGIRDAVEGFVAVVEGPFQEDLSQMQVVRDEVFELARWAAQEAEDRAWKAVCDAGKPSSRSLVPWMKPRLRERLRQVSSLHELRPGGALRHLAEIPLWRTLHAGPVPTARLVDRLEEGHRIDYSDVDLAQVKTVPAQTAGATFDPQETVYAGWQLDPADGALLKRLFGPALRSRTDEVLGLNPLARFG